MKKINEALKEPCLIKIENTKQGTRMNIEGGRLTLLLVLAGAEKGILKQLDCSEKEYIFIKEIVGMNDKNK